MKRYFFSFLGQYCRIFWSSYLGPRTLSRILSLQSLSITSLVKSLKWVSICICFSQRLRKWALFCVLDHLIWIFGIFHVKMVDTETLWFKMPNLIRKFVLMLYGFYIIFLHNTSLSKHQRFQEKWKRPTKVMKAKSKAREWIILDFHDFLAFLEQLGVVY